MSKVGMETRSLMTNRKPVEGQVCKGKETFADGQVRIVETGIVKELKEFLSGKYYMKTDNAEYIVDVICPF